MTNMTFAVDEYKTEIQSEFNHLLSASEKANQLYYFLNLHNGWGMHAPLKDREHASSMDFNAEINLITNALILDRNRNGKSIPVPPQDLLFVFQISIEQKGFYAVVRNFISTAEGRTARQEPWREDEWNQRTGLKTGAVIRNIHRELQEAGFEILAEEFKKTHTGKARIVRNAIAHGNFRIPRADTGGQWVFGNYAGAPPNHMYMNTTRLTETEFQDLFLRLLAFRLAFFGAAADHQTKHTNSNFSFTSPNQMKPSEILKCQYDKGSITIKCQGTR